MFGMIAWVLVMLAIFSWIVAAIAAISVVRLAPRGRRLGMYGRLGWWRFGEIESELGPAAVPHIRAFQRAVVAFFVLIVAGLVIGEIAATQLQNQVS